MEMRQLPKFQNEAEEARWGHENREELAKDFVNAVRDGRTGPGAVERMKANRKAAADAQKKNFPVAS
jgi:hypothetical protein